MGALELIKSSTTSWAQCAADIDDIITSRGYELGRNPLCLGEINLAKFLTSADEEGGTPHPPCRPEWAG